MEIPEIGLYACVDPVDEGKPYVLIRLKTDSVTGEITVRSKRDGDTIKSGGVTKKLKRIFCDRHIPSHLRYAVPVLEDENGIIAVGDICVRDGCKPTGNDKKMTVAFYKPADNI